jgi:hypothetical protein
MTTPESSPRTRQAVVFGRTTVCVCAVLAAALVTIVGGAAHAPDLEPGLEQDDGRAPTAEELVPSVEAAFADESYAPGARASLVIASSAPGVSLRIYHAGPERVTTVGHNQMVGVPVSKVRQLGDLPRGVRVTVPIGEWPSGVYFAKLHSSNHLVGFAPFVLRPSALGRHPVALVVPTRTWQAYNLRDENGDGVGDSWYARWRIHTVRLGRPFLNRGVPYHWRLYDLPFIRWLDRTNKHVDYLADSDLDAIASGSELAHAYKLIIFPSHHEYVTTHEYDVVERYRDLGGNLMFMYANDFFWQVVKRGDVLERTKEWRDLGRPESALIGVQYRASNSTHPRLPWVVRRAPANRWLFAGTSIHVGSSLSLGGVEIDRTTSDSPPGTQVLAEIPNIFGPGFTAQMTYYETSAGAKVFAAGAFTLVGMPPDPPVARMLENLWRHMTSDRLPTRH